MFYYLLTVMVKTIKTRSSIITDDWLKKLIKQSVKSNIHSAGKHY